MSSEECDINDDSSGDMLDVLSKKKSVGKMSKFFSWKITLINGPIVRADNEETVAHLILSTI